MVKTHFATGPAVVGQSELAACGRGKRVTSNVYDVDCGLCRQYAVFQTAKKVADAARETAFQAQVPRTVVPQFGRVNDDGVMECPECAGVLWRERPRTLFSYHYVCAECDKSVFPMTETGMCT